jgi:hypothetical protein
VCSLFMLYPKQSSSSSVVLFGLPRVKKRLNCLCVCVVCVCVVYVCVCVCVCVFVFCVCVFVCVCVYVCVLCVFVCFVCVSNGPKRAKAADGSRRLY